MANQKGPVVDATPVVGVMRQAQAVAVLGPGRGVAHLAHPAAARTAEAISVDGAAGPVRAVAAVATGDVAPIAVSVVTRSKAGRRCGSCCWPGNVRSTRCS